MGRERRLEGRDGVLGAGAASSLKVVLDEIADGSGVVDVDGSGRKAGVEGLTRQGLVTGKGQRAAVDQVERALAAQTVDTGARDDDVVEASVL